ncbi:hypothetical protein [Pseudovibrio sp. Tun.PSC04-5.I4]|uniref:hypothetical protein n=1 Tax=Pseudovibrio sp. Tun.PSC04-5.I4 TaxID=1798213 RepID=UPI00088C2D94|nr:hypothetical protein [Pseudovibrio sp. Tun.PSC04-5.I4]SDR49063.1 hypothetical protein SAMN04515695_6116 [Pseudovibrio sp. Tun.PSC04-5.I4]
MRAGSAINVHIQKPLAIFGMPPLFATIVLIGEIVMLALLGIFAGGAITYVVVLASAPPAIAAIVIARRRDLHCETLWMLPLQFFKQKPSRVLLAGVSQNIKKTKRVKR